VRKRKFPLDQTIRHDAPIPVVKNAEPVIEEKKETVKEEKKDDLQMTWANMQASVNDGLAKQLTEPSAKFDTLAGKYEEKKKAKAVKPKKKPKPKKVEEYEYYSDDEPPKQVVPKQIPQQKPHRQAPPQQAPKSVPPRLPVGVYRRQGPLSINQF
jgi:hypothetical protein